METRARSAQGLARAVLSRVRRRPDRVTWQALLAYLGCALVAALVALPVVAEQAVEDVRFSDELGTFPVEVSLCHDGRSTLDTGILGKVFWDRTGAYGFGAYARAAGPPEAGGTLASYVDPEFIQANVSFIQHPDAVVAAYSEEMRSALRARVLRDEALAALIGGAVLFVVLPRRRLQGVRRRPTAVAAVLVVSGALGLSTLAASALFAQWDCNDAAGPTYTVPEMANPTFSSPQMSEIVSQVRPFIDKNTRRIDAAADRYEDNAATSLTTALLERAPELEPRDGEKLVLAEADTQGSYVGVAVRKTMYSQLVEALGEDAIALRTIAGDVTSNGTVAESDYVQAEADVAPDVPTVAVAGDHDSEKTWQQLQEAGMTVPDLAAVDVDGFRVVGANDREHKTLFGGSVTNESGIGEIELGSRLREEVGDEGGIVVMHQPSALVGYLGLDNLTALHELPVSGSALTTPYDDGLEDLPPGTIDIGHLHEPAGPWVVWNTEGDAVTWTVIDQLGTAGGVENTPTFSRFSTPFSAPLKPITVRLQYVDTESGLQTGYATVQCGIDARCTVSGRVEVGLPGGEPGTTARPPTTPPGG